MQGILLTLEFNQGSIEYYLLIIVFMTMLVLLYMFSSSKRKKLSRADELQQKYSQMNRETLEAIPDEGLVNAVVANIMEKLDSHHPDAYATIPQLSRGRCIVYSVWLMCKELEAGSFEDCFESPSGEFGELAASGFDEIGAPNCAMALRKALISTEEEELAELHADFLEASLQENPLQQCVTYIRDNPDDFLDTTEDESINNGVYGDSIMTSNTEEESFNDESTDNDADFDSNDNESMDDETTSTDAMDSDSSYSDSGDSQSANE